MHRKLIQWGWYQDSIVKCVFLHLLLTANFKDSQWMGIPIKRGQVVIGTNKLADELGISRQQLRTALNKLKSTNEITIKSTNKFTLVTVVNWDNYQCEEEGATSNLTSTLTNEQPTDNQRITNEQPQRKNDKNDKNDKNKNNKTSFDAIASAYTQNPKLISVLNDFREMRKSIKAPMTDKALELMLIKLDKLGSNDEEKISILEQSIEKSWRGIFELKERGGNSGKHRADNAECSERVEETEGERLNRIALERAGNKPGGLRDIECDF